MTVPAKADLPRNRPFLPCPTPKAVSSSPSWPCRKSPPRPSTACSTCFPRRGATGPSSSGAKRASSACSPISSRATARGSRRPTASPCSRITASPMRRAPTWSASRTSSSIPATAWPGNMLAEADWLRRCHSDGAMLASACSGAVLLGEAGLLNHCEATIHWGYVATLTNNYPGVRVKTDRSLVLSGEAQRIVMAGGGSSWQDLDALSHRALRRPQGGDRGGQGLHAAMARSRPAALCRSGWPEAQRRCHGQRLPGVACGELPYRQSGGRHGGAGRPPRTLLHPPLLQGHGHDAAGLCAGAPPRGGQQLLETGDLPVEAIAEEVGYQDTSFFGRLADVVVPAEVRPSRRSNTARAGEAPGLRRSDL